MFISFVRRAVAALGALLLYFAMTASFATPASAALPTAKVMSATTQRMSGPSLNFYQFGTFAKGKTLTLRCHERGQAVRGYYSPWVPGGTSNIWYRTAGDGNVWVADIDLNTGSNNPVVPRCPANLPWSGGAGFKVSQGPGGSYSHTNSYNRYAIDFALPSGSVLRAPETGTVVFRGWDSAGGGNVTLIRRDGTSDCIQFAHQSSFNVSVGQRVIRGQVIGRSGATGAVSGAHLHLGVVNCSTWQSRYVLPTQERGTSYPVGTVVTSTNAR